MESERNSQLECFLVNRMSRVLLPTLKRGLVQTITGKILTLRSYPSSTSCLVLWKPALNTFTL